MLLDTTTERYFERGTGLDGGCEWLRDIVNYV